MLDMTLLKKLCTTNGISGDESKVRELIISEIQPYADSIRIDPLGNLLVFKKGKQPAQKKLLISAHMDEVGFIVTYITENGCLKFAPVGGINDSAALSRADLSIAMGRGSDLAIHTAMATVVSSDLRKVPQLIRLSKKTGRIVRENLFWAFFYNVLAVPVAAGALYPVNGFLLNPMVAAACMALSSVCVVANSLRLRRA